MRNVLRKNDGRKFHITSYRVWALRVLKRGVLGGQKCNFLQMWSNLQGRLKLTISQKPRIAKKIIYAKNERQVNSNLPWKFGYL